MIASAILDNLRGRGVEVCLTAGELQLKRIVSPLPRQLLKAMRRQIPEMIEILRSESGGEASHRITLPLFEEETLTQHVSASAPRWSAETAELANWFDEVRLNDQIPAQPFNLTPEITVSDPAGFYAALKASVDDGPSGPWAEAVMDDLRLLRELSTPIREGCCYAENDLLVSAGRNALLV